MYKPIAALISQVRHAEQARRRAQKPVNFAPVVRIGHEWSAAARSE
jgi:hypothetical protein